MGLASWPTRYRIAWPDAAVSQTQGSLAVERSLPRRYWHCLENIWPRSSIFYFYQLMGGAAASRTLYARLIQHLRASISNVLSAERRFRNNADAGSFGSAVREVGPPR